jgi:hypothetical protein
MLSGWDYMQKTYDYVTSLCALQHCHQYSINVDFYGRETVFPSLFLKAFLEQLFFIGRGKVTQTVLRQAPLMIIFSNSDK